MKLNVGDVITLEVPLLGNSVGARGVVYNTYTDFEDDTERGTSIIFENGEYDGFSIKEQDIYLREADVQYIPFYIRGYRFTNVMKLSKDYDGGFFDEILNQH